MGEYVKKSSKIYIEGRLQTSSWEDKQSGEKNTALRSSQMIWCCSVAAGEAGESHSSRGASASAGFDQRAPQAEEAPQPHPAEITDEDIPF